MRPRDESEAVRPPEDGDDRFRRHFEEFYPRVVRYFIRHGFAREEARDLAQETFLRTYRSAKDLRNEASFATYLFAITRSLALNEFRRRGAAKRRGREVPLDESLPEWPSLTVGAQEHQTTGGPLDQAISEERQRYLREALSELPPSLRHTLLLSLSGLKYSEIAVMMHVSVDSVKAYLHQARRRLQEKLADVSPKSDRSD